MDLGLILAISGLALGFLLTLGVWITLFVVIGGFRRISTMLQDALASVNAEPAAKEPQPRVTERNRIVEREQKTGMITVEENEPMEGFAAVDEPEQHPAGYDSESAGNRSISDFEKDVAASLELGMQVAASTENPSLSTTEATMQWDRNELIGKPPRSESIVVQGAELKKQQPVSPKAKPAPVPNSSKKEDTIISGEDVVDKLDSFFGFDDK